MSKRKKRKKEAESKREAFVKFLWEKVEEEMVRLGELGHNSNEAFAMAMREGNKIVDTMSKGNPQEKHIYYQGARELNKRIKSALNIAEEEYKNGNN